MKPGRRSSFRVFTLLISWCASGTKERKQERQAEAGKTQDREEESTTERINKWGQYINLGDTGSSCYGTVAGQVRHDWNCSRAGMCFCHKRQRNVY